MTMGNAYSEFATLLSLAALVGVIAVRLLRQPLIVA
jgi:hypothetical protein